MSDASSVIIIRLVSVTITIVTVFILNSSITHQVLAMTQQRNIQAWSSSSLHSNPAILRCNRTIIDASLNLLAHLLNIHISEKRNEKITRRAVPSSSSTIKIQASSNNIDYLLASAGIILNSWIIIEPVMMEQMDGWCRWGLTCNFISSTCTTPPI